MSETSSNGELAGLPHPTDGDTSTCPCPWCGETMRDLWEIAPDCDGDEVETWCGWCEKPVRFVAQYTYKLQCHAEPDDDSKTGINGS